MVKTFGLTHIALAVRDAEQAFRFYAEVFGVVEVYRDTGFIQAQTPGSRGELPTPVDPRTHDRSPTLPASRARS